MTPHEAAKVVAMLVTAWPEAVRWQTEEQQAETRRLYREFLLDLDYAVGDGAVRRLIASWRPTGAERMPSVGLLRATVSALRFGRPLAGGEAWGEVQRLIRKFGAHRTPGIDFGISDPVVGAIVAAMGWRELCLSENPAADRARVMELAEQLSEREAMDRTVGDLAPAIPVRRIAAPAGELLADIVQRVLPKPEGS